MAVRVVCVGLALTLVVASFAWAQEAPRPLSVLIDSWTGGDLDNDYMQALTGKGLRMDAIAHHELTWDRLRQYNVLVLFDFPQQGQVAKHYGGGPARGPNLEETLALVDRFLQAGGGLMVVLIQHGNDVDFYDSAQKALARWGARRPLETISVPASALAEHPRLHINFFYTDQVGPSPVSEGVKGIWWVLGGPWTYFSGPLDVDDSWTVVLRAPQGSRTEPIALGEPQPGVPFFAQPFQRPGGVLDPPLFAIRDLQPGRVALFHLSPIFHFGSGTSWFHNGAVLDKGLMGKPSDFGRLLENTLRWLGEPSAGSEQLGGAQIASDRWVPDLLKPGAKERFDGNWPRGPEVLNPHLPPPAANLFRGIIGPRTVYSGGKGTVADYAQAARAKGLSFLIFLEDFAQLTPEELAALVADCKAHSGEDLLLLAGYRMKTNIGNSVFFFGSDPLYVYEKHRTGLDKKVFKLQGEDEQGKFAPGDSINFIFESLRNDVNSVGYFDFTGPAEKGGWRIEHARLFSMAGVVYYDHGKFVEDVTDQYLTTNQGTMAAIPVAINLVDSPQEMTAEIDQGHALTYAAAPSVKQLWDTALRWNHQYFGCNVFPSSGPLIRAWPGTYRTQAFAGENFVTWRTLLAPWVHVTAEAGLKEVALYDGEKLFRRFLPGGAPELKVRLYLSGALQMNVSIVATDLKGGKAVSFPLRGWNDGSPAAVFCGDHVNDCGGMKLFRGPAWQRAENVPLVPNAGQTWDGGPSPALALFPLGQISPALTSDQGSEGSNLNQVPYLDFCDEKVHQGRSVSTDSVLPGVVHINPWSGYGPRTPHQLAIYTGIYTEWQQYFTGTPTAWGAHGIAAGPGAALYTQIIKFQRDQVVKSLALSGLWRPKIPANVMLVVGDGDRILSARDVSAHVSPVSRTYHLPTGGWWAGISPQEGNAQLHVNLGAPLELRLWDNLQSSRFEMWVALPPEGLPVKAGQEHEVRIFTYSWPMDARVQDTDDLLRWVRYLAQPDAMQIRRGKRLEAPPGIIEFELEDGALEVSVPKPTDGLDATLPCRARGCNPRWTALLFQYEGYNGAARYGPPTNRVRPLGIDPEGRVCFPIFAGQAANTHLLVGQPIVADEAGKDLFIQVTCLREAQDEAPPLWHVSVNNPTDQPITSKLRKTMDLPGLTFSEQTLTLQPGEYRVLEHPET